MRAGDLDRRITIQKPSTEQDEWGQRANEWSDVCSVWASISDISGREYVSASAERSEISTRIIIRERSGINASMRVVRGDDIYNILAVLNSSHKLQLLCKRHGD